MHLTSASPREKGTRAEVETLLILNNATESSSLSLEEGGWGRGGGCGIAQKLLVDCLAEHTCIDNNSNCV